MTPPLPWRASTPVDPAATYAVAITRLPLARHRRIPTVMRQTVRIVRALAGRRPRRLLAEGRPHPQDLLDGLSLGATEAVPRLRPLGRPHYGEHRHRLHMNEPRIDTTVMPGTDLPPSWSQVRHRLTAPCPVPV